MDDERPTPVVVIDNWNTQEMNFHNSPRAGEAYGDFNGDGTETYEWYLNFDFKTRVTFSIRHKDEVDAVGLQDSVKNELRLIRNRPTIVHSDLKQCTVGGSGNPSNEFTEPKEMELTQSARFHGDHTITRSPSDTQQGTLDSVQDTFTFNP